MPSPEPVTPGRDARLGGAAAAVALAWLAHAALPSGAASPPSCEHPRREAVPAGRRLPSVHCEPGRSGLEALEGPAGLLFGRPLDANRAQPHWLEVLPGIGPARAAAWARERERRSFCRVEDLTRIPGIGTRRLARMAGWIRVPAEACGEGGS